MIYIQHGPSWKPKMDLILNNKLADGIIWDPREEKKDRIVQIKSENKLYSTVNNIVDLKWYYAQFQNSSMKELENLDYMPHRIIDRTYLRNKEELNEKYDEMINFQDEIKVNYYTTPSLYLSSFNERYVDRLFDIWDDFKNKDLNKDIYISLMIHESAFDNENYMREFINDISNYINHYSGIYMVIDRDNTSTFRNGFSESRLAQVMQFIYDLKRIGYKVIIGYCGLESINYMAVGADIIGTGWFYSLRKFNKLEKGLEITSRRGKPKKRYTSINYLNELSIDDHILLVPDEQKKKVLPIILNNSKYDELIKNGVYDTIPTNDMFCQYFETMNLLSLNFEKLPTIEEKIEYLENIIKTAIINVNSYNSLREQNPVMNPLEKAHLLNYSSAIKIFKEQNFI